MTKKAVCLISGGLDSAVAAYIAKKQGYELYALTFRYGQRHTKELSCAKKITKAVGVKDHIIFNIDLQKFGGSSLLSSSSRQIENHALKDIGKSHQPMFQREILCFSHSLLHLLKLLTRMQSLLV
jgi:7-cyano-7-deazaguanine synthase